MARILVTGGAGFIGSHVAKHLVSKDHDVLVMDDLSGGFRDNVPEGATFIQASVADTEAVKKIFYQFQPEYVFHLAAYAAEGLSHFIRHYNYTNNVLGSINLINASIKAKVKRFIFTSSIAVYGHPATLPVTENMTPRPCDPYGIAKYTVEQDLKAAYEMFGLRYTIFRPFNVYGPGQNIGDRYRNVVGIFMNQVMRGEPMTIFGDGMQTRAFSYIDDVAPRIAESINNPYTAGHNNPTLNIGGGTPYTVLEVAQEVAKAFNAPLTVTHLPPRNEVKEVYAKTTNVDTYLPIFNKTKLWEGVGKMAEWARKVGPRATSTFTNIEVSDNLPQVWLKPT